MSYWLLSEVSVFVLCVLLAGVLIPKILLVAFRKSLFDIPDERKIHKGAVPRLGGIAFIPVVCFSVALTIGVLCEYQHFFLSDAMGENVRQLSMFFCSLFLLYIVGLGDDLVGIRYRAKFVIQIICSVLVVIGGIGMDNLFGILSIDHVPVPLNWVFTTLFIVYVVNAVNLIDGIDGLASGLSMVGFIVYGVYFNLYGDYAYAVLSFAFLGVLLPFYYYNVFGDVRRQRKIFMGDSGSLTIGLALAFLSLRFLSSPRYLSVESFNPVILAWAPLFVPCFDVVRVFVDRLRQHHNPFLPDKIHIHHKLLSLGISSRYAMVSIVAFSLLMTLLNIWMSEWVDANLLVIVGVLFWFCLNIFLTKKIAARQSRE